MKKFYKHLSSAFAVAFAAGKLYGHIRVLRRAD